MLLILYQVFNSGITEEKFRIRETCRDCADTVLNSRVEFVKGAEPDTCFFIGSILAKFYNLLPKFKPKWTARLGAKQLYEAFRKVGVTVD